VPGADPSPPSCPFCALFADRSLAPRDLTRLSDPTGDPARPVVWGFTPLSPVTPGHRLVVPERHVRDAAEDPHLTARVFEVAAVLLQELQHPANLVTSLGTVATQTVFHLHVHVVPRSSYDELRRAVPALGLPARARPVVLGTAHRPGHPPGPPDGRLVRPAGALAPSPLPPGGEVLPDELPL
jgi:histidine triad (HIT) family protein